MTKKMKLKRFEIRVSQEVLDDLNHRLMRTRWPNEPANAGWRYGTNLSYMRKLVAYWLDGYDWRAAEKRLNRFPQYVAEVSGYHIHFLYEPGSGDNPLPLVITHGWPGSFVEFLDIIEPLAHPERFGGDVADAFDVVVPSMPGYGWSSPPAVPITTRHIATLWNELMTEVLGYEKFVAQGGDWGSLVASWLGFDFPNVVKAIHINMMGLRPFTGKGSTPLSHEEEAWLALARDQLSREDGYQHIQGTKPQTLAYGLTDSPVGLAAWIIEKFHGWTNPQADEPPFTMDQLLTNVMIYWITESANTASWLYSAARREGARGLGKGEHIGTPTGFISFPNDLFPPPPLSWVKRTYNCVHSTEMGSGGHFAALERGEDLIADMRTFFRCYRE